MKYNITITQSQLDIIQSALLETEFAYYRKAQIGDPDAIRLYNEFSSVSTMFFKVEEGLEGEKIED